MRTKTLITSLCLMGLLTVPVFAANNKTKVDTLSAQTKALQKQVVALRREVAQLEAHNKNNPDMAGFIQAPPISKNIPPSEADLLIRTYVQSLPLDWDNPGQSFVAIGPYVNTSIQFSGGNLIINDPKINTDVALLKLRKAAHEGMVAKGIHTENETHHSHLLLSGNLAGQGQYISHGQQGGNLGSGNNGSSSNIDLANAEIDAFLISPSPWVSGFMSLSYNNGSDPNTTNSRVLDSNIFLNNAFIMLGDFTQSPAYATVGQMFVPFGTYSSVFLSATLPKRIARTKARALLAGYQGQSANSFYTSVYAFKGDSHASATSRINNGGVNVGYKFDFDRPDINGDIGVGYLANIADSVGMQYTAQQPEFNGFGGPTPYGNEKIVHRVPAVDLRAKLAISDTIDLIGEYIGVTTSFNPKDLSFNASGASPWALNTEASYTFKCLERPTSVGIGYSQAREALALGLPERRIGAVVNTSIWHNTIQALEFRHDINYAQSKVASGSLVTPTVTGLGTYDNVVTLEFDIFF